MRWEREVEGKGKATRAFVAMEQGGATWSQGAAWLGSKGREQAAEKMGQDGASRRHGIAK